MNRISTARRPPGEPYAMLVGILSGALYAAIYVLQRAMSPLHASVALRTLVVLYVAAIIAIFVCYAAIVSLASRGALRDDRARLLAFVFPILFSVALMLGRPYLSTDVLTYIGQGHQVVAGHTPYTEPVKALADTPFGVELSREGWQPIHDVSPYGPLWTQVEAVAGFVTSDVETQALLIKLVVTTFSLGCAVLIWLIVGQVSPRYQVVGTILYLWNPVVVVEFAGEGHNDAVMIFFLLLSLYLWVRGRFGESVVAVGVGVLIKIVAGVFAPLEVVYLWRTHLNNRRTLGALLLGGCAAAAIAAVAYAPVWAGWETFDGIRAHARPNLMSASTPSVLYWYLTRSHSEEMSGRVLSFLISGAFLGYMAIASLRIRDAATLIRAYGRVAVVYLALAPGYWPWYAAMPIAVLALAPSETAVWSILAVSLASRLAAPIDLLRVNGVMDWEHEVFSTTIIGVWSPACVIGAFAVHRAWADWKISDASLFSALRLHVRRARRI